MIQLSAITKKVTLPNKESLAILKNLNLTISSNQSVAIKGRSGSGKTTLLNILAGLDSHYEGNYYFQNQLLQKKTGSLSHFRYTNLGIITQTYHLLTERTVYQNLVLATSPSRSQHQQVTSMLEQLNLTAFAQTKVTKLSRGESQRVAIARALLRHPRYILADEPTGALDEQTEQQIISLFTRLKHQGHSFIIATHDQTVADLCDKIYTLKNGNLLEP